MRMALKPWCLSHPVWLGGCEWKLWNDRGPESQVE